MPITGGGNSTIVGLGPGGGDGVIPTVVGFKARFPVVVVFPSGSDVECQVCDVADTALPSYTSALALEDAPVEAVPGVDSADALDAYDPDVDVPARPPCECCGCADCICP